MSLRVLILLGALLVVASRSEAQVCTYSTDGALDFGSDTSYPTVERVTTTTITVTCSNLLSGIVNVRVCLDLPAGTSGVSVADRRLTSGGSSLQYQVYKDAAHTAIWGEGGSGVTLDFMNLTLGSPQTKSATLYGRVFAGQAGKPPGGYQSSLTPSAHWAGFLLILAPDCASVTGNPATLPPAAATFRIEPSCSVSATDLGFGTVSSLAGHAATSNLSVTCSPGHPYSIALDGGGSGDVGARRMSMGASTIDYQLYRDAGRTQPWGNSVGTVATGTGTGGAQSVSVYGYVPAQGPAAVGTYTDTITVSVTY